MQTAAMLTWDEHGRPALINRRPASRNAVHRIARDLVDGIRATTTVLRDGIDRAAPRG